MREGEVVRTFRADGADIAGATYAGGIKVEPGVVAYGGGAGRFDVPRT